jgi:hypothetical protein
MVVRIRRSVAQKPLGAMSGKLPNTEAFGAAMFALILMRDIES